MKKSIFIIGLLLLVIVVYFLVRRPTNMIKSDSIDNSLSKNDSNTINLFKQEYQRFPGPSNEKVLNVSKILLAYNFSQDKVKTLLGEPSDTTETHDSKTGKVFLERFSYDIGDSRRISILYDPSGNIKSIEGVGVGFEILPIPK